MLRLKPAEASVSLETLDIGSTYMILSKQRTTKTLISAPLLFAYGIRHVFSGTGTFDTSDNISIH